MKNIHRLISIFVIVVLTSACNGMQPIETQNTGLTFTETPVSNAPATLFPSPASTAAIDSLSYPQLSRLPYAPVLNESLPKENLILATHVYGDEICYDLGIYGNDTYIVISCLPDFTYPTPGGELDAIQSAYVHRWVERFTSYEDSSARGLLKLVGHGNAIADFADKQSMRGLFGELEWVAHGYIHRGGLPSAVLISLRVLSNQLGIPLDQNDIYHFEVVDFPDTCFGAPDPDEICGQAITQGFRVLLTAQGMLYEFHTDPFGYDIRSFGEPKIAPTKGPGG